MLTILIVAVFLRPQLTRFSLDEIKGDFGRRCGDIAVALKRKPITYSCTPNPLRLSVIVFFFCLPYFFLSAILSMNQTVGAEFSRL